MYVDVDKYRMINKIGVSQKNRSLCYLKMYKLNLLNTIFNVTLLKPNN